MARFEDPNNSLEYQNELYPQANAKVTGGMDPTTGEEVAGNRELNIPGSYSSEFEPVLNVRQKPKMLNGISTGNLMPNMPGNFRSISGADGFEDVDYNVDYTRIV